MKYENDYSECPECRTIALRERTRDVQINTTTPFSKWREERIVECLECGWVDIIEIIDAAS